MAQKKVHAQRKIDQPEFSGYASGDATSSGAETFTLTFGALKGISEAELALIEKLESIQGEAGTVYPNAANADAHLKKLMRR